jgi:hypothetical protein
MYDDFEYTAGFSLLQTFALMKLIVPGAIIGSSVMSEVYTVLGPKCSMPTGFSVTGVTIILLFIPCILVATSQVSFLFWGASARIRDSEIVGRRRITCCAASCIGSAAVSVLRAAAFGFV